MNVKKTRLSIIIIIFVGILSLVLIFHNLGLSAGFAAWKWHALNPEKIGFCRLQLRIPRSCWISARTNNEMDITIVPKHGFKHLGLITLRCKHLDPNTMNAKVREASKVGYSFVTFHERSVAGAPAFGICFQKNKADEIFVTYTVPERNLVIHGISLSKEYETLLSSLLDSISPISSTK